VSGSTPSPLDVLDTIQRAAPYLRWRVCLDYSYDGERIVAIGEDSHTTLTPEEARNEALRVFEVADHAAHFEPAQGVWLDVHIVASDGHHYGTEATA